MSFAKLVKGATKPKRGSLPKQKYVDPLIDASFNQDNSLSDIFRALSLRLNDPDYTTAFKSLLVLHSVIRNGSTDNVLSLLSDRDLLKLRNLTSHSYWDNSHEAAQQSLASYAEYIQTRIKAYKILSHDIIQLQASSSNSSAGGFTQGPVKIKNLTVAKGLLREVHVTQGVLAAAVLCNFYLDDLENDLNVMALQLMVKDILTLFTAANEGVINVLEHYFEMSHIDAAEALQIYKNFCKNAEKVLEFLTAAKRLHTIIGVAIPNLKMAPVSLVTQLSEYLDDPNFEQNRLEYKANKEVSDRPKDNAAAARSRSDSNAKINSQAAAEASNSFVTNNAVASTSSSAQPQNKSTNQPFDFFGAIESEQAQTNPQASVVQQIPLDFQTLQQTGGNPFLIIQQQQQQLQLQQMQLQQQQIAQMQQQMQQQPQMTGFSQTQAPSFVQSANSTGMQLQPTGFNPFQRDIMAQPQSQQSQQPVVAPFMQQAQTGTNPFRQSMLPSMTGNIMNFPQPQAQSSAQSSMIQTSPQQHPASTPSINNIPNAQQPLFAQSTGASKNPFGIPVKSSSPVEKPKLQPSMNALLFEQFMKQKQQQEQEQQQKQQQQQQQQQIYEQQAAQAHQSQMLGGMQTGFGGMSLSGQQTGMSSVASSFVNRSTSSQTAPSSMANGSTIPPTSIWSSQTSNGLSSSPGGISGTGQLLRISPQTSTFARSSVKPFVPTSTFGTSLAESLPPISENVDVSRNPVSSSYQLSGATASSTNTSAAPNPFRAQVTGQTFSPTGQMSASAMSAQYTGSNQVATSSVTGPGGAPANWLL